MPANLPNYPTHDHGERGGCNPSPGASYWATWLDGVEPGLARAGVFSLHPSDAGTPNRRGGK
eukprot:scaffold22833_cov134-Isochrysis_galbana.AAC.5